MREIKFRAWDENRKKWVYFRLDEIVNINHESLTDDEWAFIQLKNIGQYTGLKDKNGREIYEGDIVKTSCGDIGIIKFGIPKDMTINGGEYDVDYIGFYIDIIKGDWGTTDVESRVAPLVDDYYEIEVIGNVYENPELLEGAEK